MRFQVSWRLGAADGTLMPWRGCGWAEGGDGEGALAGSERLGRGSDQRRVAVRVAAAVVSVARARGMAWHGMASMDAM